MNFKTSTIYGIKRKRDLYKILNLKKFFILEDKDFNILYSPYIQKVPKPRLIENPNENLKIVQRKIKNYLFELDFSNNVFSGVPNRSYIDNALYHINSNYFLKIDMSKFFPNTHREKIYNFYYEKMNTSPDVAKILTDISSVDLTLLNNAEVFEFLEQKKIKALNHLPSGSPISSILSYLVNIDMFDEIEEVCKKNNCIVTYYVDDITISSMDKIPKNLIYEIERITKKNNHVINKDKTKMYGIDGFKKITGCVISKNKNFVIPNKTRLKIKTISKKGNLSTKNKNSLMGLINSAQKFDPLQYEQLKRTIVLYNKNR